MELTLRRQKTLFLYFNVSGTQTTSKGAAEPSPPHAATPRLPAAPTRTAVSGSSPPTYPIANETSKSGKTSRHRGQDSHTRRHI